MFETAELGRKLAKDDYHERLPSLRTELLTMQQALRDAPFSVVVLLHGIEGAGKGDTLNRLHEWMDARFLITHALSPATDLERERPEYYRYWMRLPPAGRIGIFLGSWYTEPFQQRVGGELDDAGLDAALARINRFEKALIDDGALLIKLWLHLGKKDQKKRFKKLASAKETSWRVTDEDWKQHRQYEAMRMIAGRVIRKTSTGEAPWLVIEGTDARYRSVTVAEHLASRVRIRTSEAGEGNRAHDEQEFLSAHAVAQSMTILDKLHLSRCLDKGDYERELSHWQGELNRLSRKAQQRKRAAVLVFEGWDAAGKGGAVRRMTQALDARYYQVIPVSAPSDEEKAHHYLWRFWRQIPRAGRMTIYDRSWYGRVLVERVEGLATVSEWMRAYNEINDFEEQLVNHGIVLAKFWLHIDADEQLQRFHERERTPWKQHKITAEDYRNREKREEYRAAADEMIGRTSTEVAPWTLVEGNDKRFARVKVIQTVCKQLKEAL